MTAALEALDRTVLLINGDVFNDQATPKAIVDGLLSTTVRIHSTGENLSSPAGQAVLVSLVGQLAMMGIGIDLAIPADIPVIAPQPPVQGSNLLSGLIAYVEDLIPEVRVGQNGGPAHLTLVLGDSPCSDDNALRISGDGWTCRVERAADSPGSLWAGSWPLGALAGAGAAAPEALRIALQRIARNEGLSLAPTWSYEVGRSVRLDLSFPGCRTQTLNVGRLDCISGGAITTAALYTLLRFPCSGEIRVIEPDAVEVSNLNRYALMRRSDCRHSKAVVLAGYSRESLVISPISERYGADSAGRIGPLAPRVLVGVDHIPSRWAVQRMFPDWLCVGSTSHFFSLVSVHQPDSPCAACLHPRDEHGEGPIPTISFVSFWAGLLQVRYLLASLQGYIPAEHIYCWPFGLAGRRALSFLPLPVIRDCPIQCPASRALAPLSSGNAS